MPNYIRRRHPGGTYFFTARLADRSSTLLVDEIDRLRNAMRQTIDRYPFKIEAIAVLPSAIHTLWTLPPNDSNFSLRWSMLKAQFSRGLPDPIYRSPSQQRRQDKGLWQQRFWEHLIRDAADYDTHLQMIHTSPVQAGLCATPFDWPHSSVHRSLNTNESGDAAQQRSGAHLSQGIRTQACREEAFAHHP